MATVAPKNLEFAEPAPYLWTREQYEQAIVAGIFDPTSKVELLRGEIRRKMSPQYSPHSSAIGAMQQSLEEVFPTGHWIRIQLPLALGRDSEPEPDVASSSVPGAITQSISLRAQFSWSKFPIPRFESIEASRRAYMLRRKSRLLGREPSGPSAGSLSEPVDDPASKFGYTYKTSNYCLRPHR